MNFKTNNEAKSKIGLSALENVYDPEVGLDVVSLGLIYQIDFDENAKKVLCTMTLTTEFCPMGESIIEDVKKALQQIFLDEFVEVNLVFNPSWNYNMISEKGRLFLGRL